MEAREWKKTRDTNMEVGEIDTSAPFKSVKQAVSLFGAVRFMKKRTTPKLAEPHSSENIIAKETRLHLAEQELENLNQQFQLSEAMKTQALTKLEEAKNVVKDLRYKLLAAIESKDSAEKDTVMSLARVKELECENDSVHHSSAKLRRESLQSFRDQYTAALVELTAAKNELTKARQEHDASQESNEILLKRASVAEEARRDHLKISSELPSKIQLLKESILEEKSAAEKARLNREQIFAEKYDQRQAYKARIAESARQLQDLQKHFPPEFLASIESQLESKLNEIKTLRQEMEIAKASDLASIREVALELRNAEELLLEIIKEETSLKPLVESLNVKLLTVKNEVTAVTLNESELESLAENLHLKLGMVKSELELRAADELKLRSTCNELTSDITQLSNESKLARQEVQGTNAEIEILKLEKEAYETSHEDHKLKLQELMQEAELVKSAEAVVLNQIKLLSAQTNSARSSLSSSSAKLMLSKEEYGSLKHKSKESNTLTDMKVAAAMAQIEAIKSSENEYTNKLHLAEKELKDLKLATADAMKKAAMSEAAKSAIEGELRRLSEAKLSNAAKAASESSPEHHTKVSLEKMLGETWKKPQNGDKATLSKRALLPNLSGILHRK